jgi:NAD(P)-dependent dehydrogenase (short-subunit alcohol dehydrogenase family)
VEAEFVVADVRHDDEVRSLVDQTVKRVGRLDVAVNNAGTEDHLGPVTEQSTDSYAATFDTNVLGTLLSLNSVMVAQGMAALSTCRPPWVRSVRRARQCTRQQARGRRTDEVSGARSCGSGVRVNAVAPGPIETEMLNRFTGSAVGKAGLVAGVAQTIVFLASDKAPFLTGQSIAVDGGKLAS